MICCLTKSVLRACTILLACSTIGFLSQSVSAQSSLPGASGNVYVSVIPVQEVESLDELIKQDESSEHVAAIPNDSATGDDAELEKTKSSRPAWLQAKQRPANTIDLGQLVKKVIASLVLVLALCYGIVFFMKKSPWGRFSSAVEPRRSIKVIDSMKLGPKSCLQLVEVDKTRYVVGVNSTGINSIVANRSFAEHFDSENSNPD